MEKNGKTMKLKNLSWFPQKPFQNLGGKNPQNRFLKTGKPGKTGKTLKLIWPLTDVSQPAMLVMHSSYEFHFLSGLQSSNHSSVLSSTIPDLCHSDLRSILILKMCYQKIMKRFPQLHRPALLPLLLPQRMTTHQMQKCNATASVIVQCV